MSAEEKEQAAERIKAWAACMSSRIKTAGRGVQNAEMLLVAKTDGQLAFEDFGGWALRNESMTRLVRAADALDPLPDFSPVLIQTGDRCVAKRTAGGTVELDLWQQQPVPAALRERLPLDRVLSMCSSTRYADVAVPDWCYDAWPEAGVAQGGYDAACAALAAAGAQPPADDRLCWVGTAHHHPSRMKLVKLGVAHPELLACSNVADRRVAPDGRAAGEAATDPAFMSMREQLGAFRYALDIQGKGYSSRLKLLLHSGRPVFVARRPWVESFARALRPWVHYIPVREDLGDLVQQVWEPSTPG